MRAFPNSLVALLAYGAAVGCSSDDGPSSRGAADSGADSNVAEGGPVDATSDGATSLDGPSVTEAGDTGPSMLAITGFSEEVWTWDQTIDACGYSNNGNPFWKWVVVGREPELDGTFPVFIYLHGTGDVADNPVAVSIVESMAARGFVAASVPYDSLSGLAVLNDPSQACLVMAKKVECEFGSGEGSAVTQLCARAKADCSRGIVVAGHSQGSWIATLARNVEPRVRAVWGLGTGIHAQMTVDFGGVQLELASDLSACMPPAARALPADRLRVVNGETEYVYGPNLQSDVREVTGIDCPLGAMECLRPNGSGWSFFPDAANEDGRGVSEHCYMANMPDGDCTASTSLNSIWTGGTESHAREPCLDWLASFTDA
jgi:hypothetical protein